MAENLTSSKIILPIPKYHVEGFSNYLYSKDTVLHIRTIVSGTSENLIFKGTLVDAFNVGKVYESYTQNLEEATKILSKEINDAVLNATKNTENKSGLSIDDPDIDKAAHIAHTTATTTRLNLYEVLRAIKIFIAMKTYKK